MRFGKTLQSSIYPPWRDHYIDYPKLKKLLHEGEDSDGERASLPSDDDGRGWTEHDESVFVEELINVQLEKVNNFQRKMNDSLKERTASCEAKLEDLVALEPAKTDQGEGDNGKKDQGIGEEERQKALKDTLGELDKITTDINELEKYSRVNFTGFLKAAKKHDRRPRGGSGPLRAKGKGKGKGKDGGSGEYKVRPLLQVRLSALEFNKEDYSPLLYRLSAMYAFVRQSIDKDPKEHVEVGASPLGSAAQGNSVRKYTTYKFWVHPDNVLEVKTFILRRLPVLIYNPQPSKEIDSTNRRDPTINSLYFDNPKFSLYTSKVSKQPEATSLRLRWYGQLSQKPAITLERKTMIGKGGDDASNGSEGAIEERLPLKEKYLKDFVNGTYSMEKMVQKMRDRKSNSEEDVEKYIALVNSMQNFMTSQNLQPVLRAVYTRTAFQIPGDDRVRVSIDTDLALIREDALDSERPCRDPEDWHRKDIDDAEMDFPFPALRKGEIQRFPYALLEIKVLDLSFRGGSKEWVHDLMNSHLVKEAPRFSKFVHGVSVLFEDNVNTFPFWLSEMDKDIRQDPKQAYEEEQERERKRFDDEIKVGSFKPSPGFGGRSSGTPPMSKGQVLETGMQSPTEGDRRFPQIAPQGSSAPRNGTAIPEAGEEVEEEDSDDDLVKKTTTTGPSALENLRSLFPNFSSTRYGRAHSSIALPPGIHKPKQLIMHSGPIQVEAKVWLANQRTFIKWQHVSILLATLSVGLYNAAGKDNQFAKIIAGVYTAIAVFASAWGWGVYMWRSKLIRERSGKDFDSVVGPVVVCVALAVALGVNFAFKYRTVTERESKRGNATVTAIEATDIVEEVLPVLKGIVKQAGY